MNLSTEHDTATMQIMKRTNIYNNVCFTLLSLDFVQFYVFSLYDFVLYDFVLYDFVLYDFVLYDFVLYVFCL